MFLCTAQIVIRCAEYSSISLLIYSVDCYNKYDVASSSTVDSTMWHGTRITLKGTLCTCTKKQNFSNVYPTWFTVQSPCNTTCRYRVCMKIILTMHDLTWSHSRLERRPLNTIFLFDSSEVEMQTFSQRFDTATDQKTSNRGGLLALFYANPPSPCR